jgi:hypothetical protein
MFASLLDHLAAIVIGTVLLMTMFVLQMRQRIERVDETLHHSVREHVQETMNTLAEDLQNAMSVEAAEREFDGQNVALASPGVRYQATPDGGDFLFGLDSLASSSGLTGWFAFPTRLEDPDNGNQLTPAQVVYRLAPVLETDTEGNVDTVSVSVGGVSQHTFRLERFVTFTPDGTAPADADFAPVSVGAIVDLDIELVAMNSDNNVTSVAPGPVPPAAHAVRVSMAGALPGASRLSSDQYNTRALNATRISATIRPGDL